MEYASPGCLLPTTWLELPLIKSTHLNADTRIFEFGLPENRNLALPTCACLLMLAPGREHAASLYTHDREGRLTANRLSATEQQLRAAAAGQKKPRPAASCSHDGANGADVAPTDAVRPYTPISPPEQAGSFSLLVKRYAQWGDVRGGPPDFDARFAHSFRPAGAVSNYLHELPTGAMVKFKHVAKNRKLQYPFAGVETITMVAVGAGIAPMIQALHRLLLTPGDTTKVVLLYGNRTVADILLREQLERWADEHPVRFKVVFCVGSRWNNVYMGAAAADGGSGPLVPEGWETLREDRRESGWVSKAVLARHAHPPSASTRVFVCGLPGVYEAMCGSRLEPGIARGSILHLLGYADESVVKF